MGWPAADRALADGAEPAGTIPCSSCRCRAAATGSRPSPPKATRSRPAPGRPRSASRHGPSRAMRARPRCGSGPRWCRSRSPAPRAMDPTPITAASAAAAGEARAWPPDAAPPPTLSEVGAGPEMSGRRRRSARPAGRWTWRPHRPMPTPAAWPRPRPRGGCRTHRAAGRALVQGERLGAARRARAAFR